MKRDKVKGILLFHTKFAHSHAHSHSHGKHHHSSSHYSSHRPTTPRSDSPHEERGGGCDGDASASSGVDLEWAESMINRWNPDSPTTSSLFHENRSEARDFLRSVNDVQRTLQAFIASGHPFSSQRLIHSHHLMQLAMKRLQKEFYQMLAANRDLLDSDSLSSSTSSSARSGPGDDDEDSAGFQRQADAGKTIREVERSAELVVTDLRAIAECMIESGYGKECVQVYKVMRKSIVDEGVYRLGFEKVHHHQLQKLHWDAVEAKIRNWVLAIKVAVKTLFAGERNLCDQVYNASAVVKESCITEIIKEPAIALFKFPELVSKCKRSPERMFSYLDMYETIADLWQDIESIFSYSTTSTVRSQAVTALVKLGETIRATLSDFESAIQKDSSRVTVPGGGIHPLARYVMNYICFLGDYSRILTDIFADFPLEGKAPDTLLRNLPSKENPCSPIAARFEWMILMMMCKLDSKADLYGDCALSYLFLANNIQYIVSKVDGCELRSLLGAEWISKHEEKINQFTANYKKTAWRDVLAPLPADPGAELHPHEAKEVLQRFTLAFEVACHMQASWVVPETKLKDKIKALLAKKIGRPYRALYEKHHRVFGDAISPDDVEKRISDLFASDADGSVTDSSHGHRTCVQNTHLYLHF